MRWQASALLLMAGFLVCCADRGPQVPETRIVDHTDTYHGTEVADPYRWLEQDVRESPEVAAWVEAQNKVSSAYFDSIPERAIIRERLATLWNFEQFGRAEKAGNRYFFTRNDGLQDQDVLYVLDALDGEPRVLIDPNLWSGDGTVSLSSYWISDDGRHMAYAVAEAGSDWTKIQVLDIESGKPLPDELQWVKFNQCAWTKDGKGFFYQRFDEPQDGAAYQSLNLNQQLFYHELGTAQSSDKLIYRRPDQPEWVFSPDVTSDGRYLIITTSKGTDAKYRISYKDLTRDAQEPRELITDFDNEYSYIGSSGSRLLFKTDLEAPKKRVIAIDLNNRQPENWNEIIPETEDALDSVDHIGNFLVASYLKDASTQVRVHDLEGKLVREIPFGALATVAGFRGGAGDSETFYTLQGFATPPTVYHYDVRTGESQVFRSPNVQFDPEEFETEQIFYNTKDGTRVPMFITKKKTVSPGASTPALLYGYGGFDISVTPRFSVGWLTWMEMGGVLAVANLRGGGEYGEEWHQAGTKVRKQNVFDDFIAAAEWLISNNYTSREKLAVTGRSNGGLLIGAVLTQRPDLFGACLPDVGVMDMLRFHQFTAGRFWVDDYGSADNPEEFKALLSYSPYHNIEEGVQYPPTLVSTADTDDRVVPGHSFKFAARLQKAQAGDAPILARIESRAGHGSATPTSKLIDEYADKWAFLVKTLGIELGDS